MVVRDEGTAPERLVGWMLSYPVRTLLIAFTLVVGMTLCCGL